MLAIIGLGIIVLGFALALCRAADTPRPTPDGTEE
jgi:hypothetical protein